MKEKIKNKTKQKTKQQQTKESLDGYLEDLLFNQEIAVWPIARLKVFILFLSTEKNMVRTEKTGQRQIFVITLQRVPFLSVRWQNIYFVVSACLRLVKLSPRDPLKWRHC